MKKAEARKKGGRGKLYVEGVCICRYKQPFDIVKWVGIVKFFYLSLFLLLSVAKHGYSANLQ